MLACSLRLKALAQKKVPIYLIISCDCELVLSSCMRVGDGWEYGKLSPASWRSESILIDFAMNAEAPNSGLEET